MMLNNSALEQTELASILGISPSLFASIIFILAIWDIIRKAIALRKAGNRKQMTRFIFLFIFNTLGLLPIIYLIFNRKKDK